MRRFGGTGLTVSDVALGTVEIGLDYGLPGDVRGKRPEESEAIRFLGEALDLGVTFIDTARVYGNSEELIGRALGHRRSEYVLATKLTPIGLADLNQPSLREKIRQSVRESLRNLRTDWVDVLMIHSAPIEVIQSDEQLMGVLRELQREGLARFLGASVYEEAGPAALRRGGFDCIQIAYNALDRAPETETLSLAAQTGTGIVVRSVLLKGVITDRHVDLPPGLSALKQAAAELDKLANQAGLTLPELAYRYVLGSDVVALCGTAHIEELKAAVRSAELGPLSADLIAHIRAIEVAEPALLNPARWPS